MRYAREVQIMALALIIIGSFSYIAKVSVFNSGAQLAAISGAGSGLIGYWTFDDGTATDQSGSGNNGTVSGATQIAGKIGNALSFDGISNKITLQNDLIGTGDVTVAAWIYTRANSRQMIVTNGKFMFGIRSTGTELEYRGANSAISTSQSNSIAPNAWYFVVVTRSGTNANLYVNGQLSGPSNQSNDVPVNGTNVLIGGRTSDLFFNGIIDDVHIYNRVLSASEIQELYAGSGSTSGTAPTSTPPLTASSGNIRRVAANGSIASTYSQMQACADAINPGETCIAPAGRYDERVILNRSGTSASPITFAGEPGAVIKGFTIQDQNYIVIKNFEITNNGFAQESYATPSISLISAGNVQVLDNVIHDTYEVCIKMRSTYTSDASHDIHIKGNTISHCGGLSTTNPGRGITIYGNNNLVENNDISHLGVSFTNSFGGDFNVIRNNYFHDNSIDNDWGPNNPYHLDGFADQPGSSNVGSHHVLIENNTLFNAPDHDSKFVLFQDQGSPGSSEAVVRYNSINKLGSSFLVNNSNFKNVRIYNNTAVDLEIAIVPLKNWTTADFANGSSGGKLINNIFYNNVRDGGNLYSADATSAAGFYADYNLGFNSVCGTSCTWYNPANGISKEPHGILNKDPLFAGASNFNLQSASPAIDKGGPLTTVAVNDGGSGTTLFVNDAGYFQDGWAGVQPDWIAVGTLGNIAQISSIDYTTNTIHLAASISRKSGDPVYLYKNSSGTQVLYGNAPDMGAYESTYTGTPTPTQTLVGDFDNSGTVNSADWSYMNSKWGTNDPTADLNHDGKVNTLDFGILVKNWTN